MITEEQLQAAERLIRENPERAAYHLADMTQRYHELNAAMGAIRAFSQNTGLASTGNQTAIEFAIGRKLSA